jgi:hypothetical protein
LPPDMTSPEPEGASFLAANENQTGKESERIP